MTERQVTTIRRTKSNKEQLRLLEDRVSLLEYAVKQLIVVGGQLPAGKTLGQI